MRFDPVAGEIDFDFVRHDGGIASSWAQEAAPGQVTWIAGPKMSRSHPEGAGWLLVVCDETALPAIGRWPLPAGGALVLVEQVEAADPDDIDAVLQHLRLTAAFGSGLRSAQDVTALAERAGLEVRNCRDIGWDHRLWVLTAPSA